MSDYTPDCLAAEAYKIGAGGERVKKLELDDPDATLRDLLVDLRDQEPTPNSTAILRAIDALDCTDERKNELAHRYTELVAHFATLSDRRRRPYL